MLSYTTIDNTTYFVNKELCNKFMLEQVQTKKEFPYCRYFTVPKLDIIPNVKPTLEAYKPFFYQNHNFNLPKSAKIIRLSKDDPSWTLSSYYNEHIRITCKTKNGSMISLWNDYQVPDNQLITCQQLSDIIGELGYHKKVICSTFSPTVARTIMTDLGAKKVLDTSAGWGDRMLAAMSLGIDYIGFDPNKELSNSYQRMITELPTLSKNIRVHSIGCEHINTVLTKDDMVDLLLTSPPFYDLEDYSSDKTQSIQKYSTFDSWLNQWLLPSIDMAIEHVRPGGYIVIYILDYERNSIVAPLMKRLKHLELVTPYAFGQNNFKPIWVWRK